MGNMRNCWESYLKKSGAILNPTLTRASSSRSTVHAMNKAKCSSPGRTRSAIMPAHSTDRLRSLLGRMDEGWRLEAPVIERPAYQSPVGRVSAFEFVLRHEGGCQVIAVPDCPE